ncbi:MAG: GNAT family N-acetyltransferase [Duncaniella sp.]|nr:GNAT family N-acetyltransferase [Duncaniella sp.]
MSIIRNCRESDYPELVGVWERSVRASHDFLTETDIEEIKSKLAAEYFQCVKLVCVEDEGRIVGFTGMADGKIEMLFVDAERRGEGIGGVLMDYAIGRGATSVDVNEQNRAALGFYESRGFRVSGRDETDDAGRPFPILHMSLWQCE